MIAVIFEAWPREGQYQRVDSTGERNTLDSA